MNIARHVNAWAQSDELQKHGLSQENPRVSAAMG
jgi:hypothetical protein